MRYAIWYHLYNLKNVKNTYGGLLFLGKFQALACNFTKSNTPSWVFFTFLKLYKWCQIAQRITYVPSCILVISLIKILFSFSLADIRRYTPNFSSIVFLAL